MGIFLNDANLEMLLFELLGFFGLAGLGWLLLQLIHWDSILKDNQAHWLHQLQRGRRQLRYLRRALEKAQGFSGLPLPAPLRRIWRVIGWVTTALSAAKWARS